MSKPFHRENATASRSTSHFSGGDNHLLWGSTFVRSPHALRWCHHVVVPPWVGSTIGWCHHGLVPPCVGATMCWCHHVLVPPWGGATMGWCNMPPLTEEYWDCWLFWWDRSAVQLYIIQFWVSYITVDVTSTPTRFVRALIHLILAVEDWILSALFPP